MTLVYAFIRSLTFVKLKAWCQANFAFFMARFWGKNSTAKPQPFASIEPTNQCNLHCPECVSGSGELTRPKGQMTLENFKKIVDQIYRHTLILNLYMQGEPYLNPQLGKMIAYAKAKNLFVSLSTNANIMPELSIDTLPHHLIISADGATQQGYAAYRKNGQLQNVVDFVKTVSDLKKKEHAALPYIELQFLVNKQNAHEEKATRQLFKGQYNRFVRKSIQIIHEENRPKYQAQSACCGRYIDSEKTKPGCYKMLSTAVFTQDGQLVPCCMDKNAEFAFGNVLKTDYSALLTQKDVSSFRQMLINKKEKISICQNCPFA